LISAVIEQNNDKDGIIFPKEIAPFEIIVLPLDITNNEIMKEALDIYNQLSGQGFSVLIDDRDERAGVKFKDADLIGVPLSLVIGKKNIEEKKVELRVRKTKETLILAKEEVLKSVADLV